MALDPHDDWLELEEGLRGVLAEGLEIRGTVEEADIRRCVDGSTIALVIELSDLEGHDQAGAYLVLCDLLTTRRNQGADRVMGCLVFVTRPDAEALVVGLMRMTRDRGLFTPILPLSRSQAALLAATCSASVEFVDDGVALVATTAEQSPPTGSAAQQLLDDIDHLINRHSSAP